MRITEAELQKSIMLAIGARPDCRVLRLNVGTARHPITGQVVRFGVPGMADLLVLARTGRFCWLEVKTPTGRLSEKQRTFRAAMHALAGPASYVVARSVEDAVAAVEAIA